MVQYRVVSDSVRKVRGGFYGWWLTAVAALVMVIGSVPMFQGMPAWFVVLEREFSWSRAELSLAFSFTRVEGTVMGPVAGYLVDRVGPRRMVLLGLPVLGLGFILFSQVHHLWQFYAAFVVMSMGGGLGTWLPMMTVLNHWFLRRRSLAMALAMEGFALGGIMLVPALAWAIDPEEPDRIGWRVTAAGIGVGIMVLAWPVSRLVRNRPEQYGLHPDGQRPAPAATSERAVSGPTNPGGDPPDYTWQMAIRTGTFWLITMGHACSSIVIVTLMVHLGPMLDDRGFSIQTIGWVVATYTAVGALFTLIGGYVGDRGVDPAGVVRLFRGPVGGSGGAARSAHGTAGFRLRRASGHRIWRKNSVDHGDPRGLFRPTRFRQHHRGFNDPHEHTSVDRTVVRGDHV